MLTPEQCYKVYCLLDEAMNHVPAMSDEWLALNDIGDEFVANICKRINMRNFWQWVDFGVSVN